MQVDFVEEFSRLQFVLRIHYSMFVPSLLTVQSTDSVINNFVCLFD